MIDVDEADDAEVKEEIGEECETYGKVMGVGTHVTQGRVIVFVRFQELGHCHAALAKLDGRLFDGKRIVAQMIAPALLPFATV